MGRDGGREVTTSVWGPGQAPGRPTPDAQTRGRCHQRKRGSFPSPQREGNKYHFLPCTAYKGAGSLKHEMEKKKDNKDNHHVSFPSVFLPFLLSSPLPSPPPLPLQQDLAPPPPHPLSVESGCAGKAGPHLGHMCAQGEGRARGQSCHHVVLAPTGTTTVWGLGALAKNQACPL